ncbi:Hypothetical predicted protein [Paramuricea clavata]|uniref:Uncharacterized protein n=1 Tax=Paramuricea clavata TaxID=317549 RepID=A0A7D9DJE0_PARCT|nr:Hypothetical predicted protein [Paramuricea clavata]
MNVLYPSFALLFGFLSVLTNGLSCLVFYRNLTLTFGSPIIYYFVTLTCMYFVKGIVTVCWSVSALFKSGDEQLFFKIGRYAYWTTALSLFLTLLAMVVERYMNTCSLKRLQWLRARKKVYTYFCLIIVVFSLICGLLVAIENTGHYVEFFICVVAEIAFTLTIFFYVRLWLKQRSHDEETTRREAAIHITSRCKSQFDGNKRLNVIVLCYVIATLVTVLPFFVAFQAKLVYILFHENSDSNGHLMKLLEIYPMFTCLNYGLTPLFYLFVLPRYRKSLLMLLTCRDARQVALAGNAHDSEETTSCADLV